MRTWEAAYGAADELSRKTGVRHKVYNDSNNGWFVSRIERLEDAYARVHNDVATRWKVYEKFQIVKYEKIGWAE